MPLGYDFTGKGIVANNLEPFIKSNGMIEFHFTKPKVLEALGESAKRTLMLGLKAFDLPEARKVNKATVPYLSARIKFLTTPQEVGDLNVTLIDYINGGQRLMMDKWFRLSYDPRKGYGQLSAEIKVDAHAVYWGRDAASALPQMNYVLYGMLLLNAPQLPDVDYGQEGQIMELSANFSIDDYDLEPINVGSGV